MLQQKWTLPLICAVVGGCCLSLSSGYYQNNPANPSSQQSPSQQSRPGISESHQNNSRIASGTNREEIAYMDDRDADIHSRANRKGDWDFKQNWRYDRKAFYSGKTQGEALDAETQEGAGGIGMDPDTEYLEMREYYLQQRNHNRDNGTPQYSPPNSQYNQPSNRYNRYPYGQQSENDGYQGSNERYNDYR